MSAIIGRNLGNTLVNSTLTKLCENTVCSIIITTRLYSDQHRKYDLVVVGGGIVGLATARELKIRYPHLEMAVLEKEKCLAAHQSGHNSGVIHAGIYYKPGSLKAKLCVEGMKLTYEYLQERNIPHNKCGKLIVATNETESDRLDDLIERAQANNVPDVKIVDCRGIRNIEPFCQGIRGLWSPNTGIVDWARVARSYGEDFKTCGGEIRLGHKVIRFDTNKDSSEDRVKYPVCIITKERAEPICTGYVVVCAGLYSDRVAKLSGCGRDPQIIPVRGEYLVLHPKKRSLVKGNIYPVPDPDLPFLGVHFTPRMDGNVLLGPNAVLSFEREGYRWGDAKICDIVDMMTFPGFIKFAFKNMSYGLSEMYKSLFIKSQLKNLQKYIPSLTINDIQRGPTGVRAQALSNSGELVDDFVFDLKKKTDEKKTDENKTDENKTDEKKAEEKETDICSRILHCRNAPSPGATSALAIANVIADYAKDAFKLESKCPE